MNKNLEFWKLLLWTLLFLAFVDHVKGACPVSYTAIMEDCYHRSNATSRMTFAEAQTYCSGIGGMLVSIHSAEQNNKVHTAIMGSGSSWLGRRRVDERWRWVDGTAYDYNNWASEEVEDDDNCVYWGQDAAWRADTCDSEYRALCRRPGGLAMTTDSTTDTTKATLATNDFPSIRWTTTDPTGVTETDHPTTTPICPRTSHAAVQDGDTRYGYYRRTEGARVSRPGGALRCARMCMDHLSCRGFHIDTLSGSCVMRTDCGVTSPTTWKLLP